MRKNHQLLHIGKAGLGVLLVTAFLLSAPGCSGKERINAYPQKYAGVGLELKISGPAAEVIKVFPEGPADNAGIRVGDRILKIDGETVDGLPLSSIVGMLRGASGSQVSMLVSREGATDLTIIIKRSSLEKGSDGYRSSQ